MIFKCGIVGLPNVGKSTLFNLLTFSSVKAENFPFCTIKANRGFVSVIDRRLFHLSELINTTCIIHGSIELIDIAGLIKGASQGEGLGNSFLNDISEVDIVCHVVRCHKKLDVYHVNNEINPEKDIHIIHDELILSDISLCERVVFSFEKRGQYKDKNDIKILEILKRVLINLNNGIMLYNSLLTLEEKKIINRYNFLTLKPIMYVANVDINNDINNHYLSRLSNIAINENIPYISMCFLCREQFKESEIHNLDLIKTIYHILQLKTFFTTNMKEVRAWIVSKNTLAIDAASIIHSDFKKKFIRVQVLRYHDFMLFGGWKESQKFGKVRSEGKGYLIQDGDILNFLI